MARQTWRQQMPWISKHAVDGVISVAALQRLGVDSSTAYRQPGGPWRWLLPGVVLLAPGVPSGPQRARAALIYAGSDARLTGGSAALLHGLRRAAGDDRVHVLLPHARRSRSVGCVLLDAGSKRGTALVRRDARYAAAGIAFLPTLPRRLVTEEAAVLDELEAAYAAAARRPAPVGIRIGQRSA